MPKRNLKILHCSQRKIFHIVFVIFQYYIRKDLNVTKVLANQLYIIFFNEAVDSATKADKPAKFFQILLRKGGAASKSFWADRLT